MPLNLAEIKPVRPFSHPKGNQQADEAYKRWRSKYPRIALEIGCGAGLHPISWAKNNPKVGLVAIERTQEKYKALASRVKNHALPNLFTVNADALYWLPPNLRASQVDELFLLYPNPYPKERQANKRWHRNPLFHLLLETLKEGGKIHVASNITSYIEECQLYMENFWQLALLEKREFQHSPAMEFRTHFEKKYLLSGQICTNLIYKKATIRNAPSSRQW